MNRNSQTRMTNDEIRRNDETRMTKPMTAQLRAFGHSGFGFLSSFVIRHSTTYANQVHGPNASPKAKGASHESPIPFGLPLRMKKYSARRVGLGARNLFRCGGGRTEV